MKVGKQTGITILVILMGGYHNPEVKHRKYISENSKETLFSSLDTTHYFLPRLAPCSMHEHIRSLSAYYEISSYIAIPYLTPQDM